MEQTILSNAFLAPGQSTPHLEPDCATADCQWSPYGTLAVCHDAMDITETQDPLLAQVLQSVANISIARINNRTRPGFQEIPRGYIAGASVMLAPTNVFGAERTAAALSNVLFIYTPEFVNSTALRPADLRFVEVILYACTKTLESRVHMGIKTTIERDSVARIVAGSQNSNLSLNAAWNINKFVTSPELSCDPGIGGVSVRMEAPPGRTRGDINTRFEVDLCTALMTSSLLNQYLPGIIAVREEDKLVIAGQVAGFTAPALASALFGGFLGQTPTRAEQRQNLRGMVKNIADGLTNMSVLSFPFSSSRCQLTKMYSRMRTKGATYTNSSGAVTGTTLEARTIIRVRWSWLALLATQLVLAIAFLIATAVATHSSGVQILKGSSLATLCVLDDATRDRLGKVEDVRELYRHARGLAVRLESDGTLRLVDTLRAEGG